MILSVVIPTLNEEENIRSTLEYVFKNSSNELELEVLLVDSGSNDRTLELARTFDTRIFSEPEFKGLKYKALNYGAGLARGDVLLFLDADCIVPEKFDELIRACLSNEIVVGGAFEYRASNRALGFRIIELINRIRYRIDRYYFGDQGIFCSRFAFDKVGGYPAEPIMEAAFFCRSLRKLGQIKLIELPITTSTRRFEIGGKWSVLYKDFIIWTRYLLRLDVSRYARKYWHQNNSPTNK